MLGIEGKGKLSVPAVIPCIPDVGASAVAEFRKPIASDAIELVKYPFVESRRLSSSSNPNPNPKASSDDSLKLRSSIDPKFALSNIILESLPSLLLGEGQSLFLAIASFLFEFIAKHGWLCMLQKDLDRYRSLLEFKVQRGRCCSFIFVVDNSKKTTAFPMIE